MVWAKLDGFKCPAKGCSSMTPQNLVCKKDQSALYINEKGMVKCSGTTLHTGILATWTWNCGDSWHNGEYIKADRYSFVFALSRALQILAKMDSKWCSDLISESERQLK
ncbi:hypothetical protein MAR_002126 [Mya arenaria]|uniref:Uncharacterized protein n=1 Tax=Mya arenaria TaxID=6604 RepID=A0ABY7FHW2_MYAAR|nr:uncharacterized protein LOC128208836 [Mya arenaria]WAR20288.1 hypothetical protein MAR_002126 [Mya arenaria]